MNTNYQKTGIRLRHLEQEQGDARSLSPMTANRKKIFEKPVQTNVISRNTAQYVDEPSNLHTNNIEFEYDQLVQTLKRKSLQLQQKDDIILKMKQQIGRLKSEVSSKQKEIDKMKRQIERLERVERLVDERAQIFKQQFHSFDNNVSQSSKPFAKKKPVPSTDSKNGFVLGGINQSFNNNSNQFQEISLQNLAVEKNQSFNDDEQEIVSPFMALSQERNSKSNSKILSPGNKNSRLRMQADTRQQPKAATEPVRLVYTQNSAFEANTKQIDRNKQAQIQPDRKYSTMTANFRNVSQAQLQIDDSLQFQFQDFDPDKYDESRNSSGYDFH